MDRQKLAIILIGCAVALGIGSYILISNPNKDDSVLRQVVEAPAEVPAEAPNWVDEGQKAEPDYSSADAQAQNATPVPEPEEQTTKVIEVTEDKMVTFAFVESMTDFFLNRFIPTDKNGRPVTKASAKAVNIYYGQELNGFSVDGDDIRMARKSVFNYAFTPVMVKTLYALYEPVLIAHLVDTATSVDRDYTVGVQTERRSLTEAETAIMLKLNARKLEESASILRAIATDPSITKEAGQYIQAAKAVERANLQLQNAIADEKNTSVASKRLKQAIMQRERVKKSITTTLKKACPGCPETELFYLAQWSYRRVLNQPEKKLDTFATAADVLNDLSDKFLKAAFELSK